jgi:hypothetical protein
MIFDGKDVGTNYSPDEMLSLCRVSKFGGPYWDGAKDYVEKILAILVVEKNPQALIEQLTSVVNEIGTISIGQSLQRLYNISMIGPELQGDLTGVAALTYHLGGHTCKQGIEALKKVLRQFEIDKEVGKQ